MKDPFISIITLNWNQTDVTCQFLESTRKLNYKNYEILVCDMGSNVDPTARIQRENYPNTRVMRSEENLGFTGGNNWGMRNAKGDYIFVVNNDTEVTPDLLTILVDTFQKDPSIGVVCPKILFYHSPGILQYAGFTEISVFTGRNRSIGWGEEDKGQYDHLKETFYAHGAAMLVSRAVIDKVGMFAEKFFIYYEEMDWSARIRRAGYKIMVQPAATIVHKESVTMGRESAIKVYYHTRNRILYMRRNSNMLQFAFFAFFFLLFSVPKAIFKYGKERQFTHLKSFFRGIFWNLTTSKSSPV